MAPDQNALGEAFSKAMLANSPVERGLQWTRIVSTIDTPGFESDQQIIQDV
eukprot:CAMPEP_0118943348 /NCGR_PEP_ID=MMETSP1169-20130426/38129_1 /TAXON_ID=36882 /ORGANISM="Pyramimonas obovata, Strain CCMP722" /LENGTH=50 /DNA_ID=CAMNT_0006888585 /DNA_START=52 /DNA_END=201 /DNA_ORIENTATION=+